MNTKIMKDLQEKVLEWAKEKGYTCVDNLGGPREAPRAGYEITPRGEKFLFVKFGKPSVFEATVRIFAHCSIQIRSWQPGEPCRWVSEIFAPPKEPMSEMKNAKVKGLGPRNQRQVIPWESLQSDLEKLEPHYTKPSGRLEGSGNLTPNSVGKTGKTLSLRKKEVA